jgi:hypothetical protein
MPIHQQHQHLLHDVRHGLFVRQEFWHKDWVFDANQCGQFVSVWIDSYQQYDLLDYEERKTTEAAFRHGYLESLKTIQVKLQLLPNYMSAFPDTMPNRDNSDLTDDAAVSLIYGATEAARNARCLFQWKQMAALLKSDHTAGQVVYPTHHWRRAAYLRGSHYALEQLIREWNELAERYSKIKRCLCTYVTELTLPLLVIYADHCMESTIRVSLFPMISPDTQNAPLLLTDGRR